MSVITKGLIACAIGGVLSLWMAGANVNFLLMSTDRVECTVGVETYMGSFSLPDMRDVSVGTQVKIDYTPACQCPVMAADAYVRGSSNGQVHYEWCDRRDDRSMRPIGSPLTP